MKKIEVYNEEAKKLEEASKTYGVSIAEIIDVLCDLSLDEITKDLEKVPQA